MRRVACSAPPQCSDAGSGTRPGRGTGTDAGCASGPGRGAGPGCGSDRRRARAAGCTSAHSDRRPRAEQDRTCVSGSQAQARPRTPADRGGEARRDQHHSCRPHATQANSAPAASPTVGPETVPGNVEKSDQTSSRLRFRPVHHRSTFFGTCGGGGCGVFSGRGKGSGRTTATIFVASFFAFFLAPVFSGRVAF